MTNKEAQEAVGTLKAWVKTYRLVEIPDDGEHEPCDQIIEYADLEWPEPDGWEIEGEIERITTK